MEEIVGSDEIPSMTVKSPPKKQDGLDSTRNQLLNNLIDSLGYDDTMKTLSKINQYEDAPPDVDTFLDDDYYVGKQLHGFIYPIWRKALHEIHPNPFYSPYLEVILSGCIGSGKSTVSMASFVYDVLKVSLLKNPHDTFGLVKSTKLAFALVNVTLAQSKGVLFDQIIQWFEDSYYFKSIFAGNSRSEIYLPKNVMVMMGSREDHFIGKAVPGAILSELNDQTKIKGQGLNNYLAIKNRIHSRFGPYRGNFGSWPGRMYLDSSKKSDVAFLESKIQESKTNPEMKLYEYAIWEVKQHISNYSKETFKVFCGSRKRDPFIIAKPSDIIGLDESLIVDVPMDFFEPFKNDIYKSIQDLAGKGTWSSQSFIPSGKKVDEALSEENPVTNDIIKLDYYNNSTKLIEFVKIRELVTDKKPRFIHIDVGLKKDRTGIACTRVEGFIDLERDDLITGKKTKTREIIFRTEFVMAIEALAGQEVSLPKIRDFIIDLREYGIPIGTVSADGFESKYMMQSLDIQGFDTQLISLDRHKDAYQFFKNSLMEDRYIGINHWLLKDELLGLLDTAKKIDHVEDAVNDKGIRYGKDLADAVAGSVWSANINMQKYGAHMFASDYITAFDDFCNGSEEEGIYRQLLSNVSLKDTEKYNI